MSPPDGSVVEYVSPAFEKVWGRPIQEVKARPELWLESIHPEDREQVQAKLQQQAREGVFDALYRIVRPDGSYRWIYRHPSENNVAIVWENADLEKPQSVLTHPDAERAKAEHTALEPIEIYIEIEGGR